MAISNAFNNSGGTGSGGGSGSFDGTIKEVSFTDQTELTISHDFENYPTVIILDANGNLVCSRNGSTWSMQGDFYPYQLLLDDDNGSMRLVTHGFRLFVYDVLDIDSGAKLSHNGHQGEAGQGAGGAGEGGAGAEEGTLAGGTTGGDGGNGGEGNDSRTPALAGNGGGGGGGGSRRGTGFA